MRKPAKPSREIEEMLRGAEGVGLVTYGSVRSAKSETTVEALRSLVRVSREPRGQMLFDRRTRRDGY